jgi:multiple sugar transport system permease protein
MPAIPSFIAIHWMLNGEWGFINNFIYYVPA